MLSQRSATTLAILVGMTFGAFAAWLRAGLAEHSSLARAPSAPLPTASVQVGPELKRSPVATGWLPKSGPIATGWPPKKGPLATGYPPKQAAATTPQEKETPPPASAESPVKKVSSVAPKPVPKPTLRRAPPQPPPPKPELPELTSPHDRPVTTEGQLRAAEIKCDRRDPNECLRAADAYEKGEVIKHDAERVERNKKIAHTLYMKQCDGGDAAACYQLARLYEHGEFVRKNTETAAALRNRAGELCGKRINPVCERIRELAREP